MDNFNKIANLYPHIYLQLFIQEWKKEKKIQGKGMIANTIY